MENNINFKALGEYVLREYKTNPNGSIKSVVEHFLKLDLPDSPEIDPNTPIPEHNDLKRAELAARKEYLDSIKAK